MCCSFKSLFDSKLSLKIEGRLNGAWRNLLRSTGADLGNTYERVENSFSQTASGNQTDCIFKCCGSTRETCLAGGLDYSHAGLCCHLLDTVYVWQLFLFIGYWSKTISNFETVILRGYLNRLTTHNYPVLQLLLTFRFSC